MWWPGSELNRRLQPFEGLFVLWFEGLSDSGWPPRSLKSRQKNIAIVGRNCGFEHCRSTPDSVHLRGDRTLFPLYLEILFTPSEEDLPFSKPTSVCRFLSTLTGMPYCSRSSSSIHPSGQMPRDTRVPGLAPISKRQTRLPLCVSLR